MKEADMWKYSMCLLFSCNIELSGLEITLVNTMRREYILKRFCVRMASHTFSLSVCCRKSCIGIVLWKYGTSIAA